MKFAFGLVGVLVALGVIVMIMSAGLDYNSQVIKTSQQAKETSAQITGKGFNESFTAEAVDRNGKIVALKITSVIPNEPMDLIFGLRTGDEIVTIGPNDLRDLNDEDLARGLLLDASRGGSSLVIMREGQRITVSSRPGGRLKNNPLNGAGPVQSAPVQSH